MPNPSKIHPNLAGRIQPRGFVGVVEPLRVIVQYRAGGVGVAQAIQGVVATHRTYRLIAASANSALPNAINALSDREQRTAKRDQRAERSRRSRNDLVRRAGAHDGRRFGSKASPAAGSKSRLWIRESIQIIRILRTALRR